MKLNQYQTLALKTESPISSILSRHKKQSTDVSLTEFRVLHAGLGIITEIAELQEFQSDFNYREELGDIFWFLALGYAGLNLPFLPKSRKTNTTLSEEALLKKMNNSAVTVLDWTKARIFYNRLEKNGKSYETIIKTHLDNIHACIIALVQEKKLSVIDILTANIEKLKARYPEKYTDISANLRNYVTEQEAAEKAKKSKK